MADRVALFDLDGTLTDPQTGITTCIAHALRRLDEAIPDSVTLRDWIGAPLHRTFAEYLGSEDRADAALQLYRERFSSVGLFENELFDGMVQSLADIRDRCDRLFVVTSKPRPFAERIIQHFALGTYFDGVYGSELDGRFAEKPDLLGHVLNRETIPAAQATMIGDRRYDITAATAHGVRSIGVLWGFGDRAELEAAGADAICAEVKQLPAVLFALDSERQPSPAGASERS